MGRYSGSRRTLLGRSKGPAYIFSGAATAYALRIPAYSTYSGPLVRVRRSSDNTEQDFSAVTTPDSAGNYWLGTAAILTFCGAGSGYISKWYDQSGNNNHLTQTITTSQPRIVNAGVLETQNGKPALYGTSASTYMLTTTAVSAYDHTCNAVFKKITNNSDIIIFGHATLNMQIMRVFSDQKPYIYYNNFQTLSSPTTFDLSSTAVITFSRDTAGIVTPYRNGSTGGTIASQASAQVQFSGVGIILGSASEARWNGWMSEAVFFGTQRSNAARAALENSQKVAFAIT